MPRISILLPTHNRPDVLPLAIASVLAQTEQDFEILVVGDGCTDHTGDVVTGFRDPRIRWFDLPKAPGFGYANRNVALREATGDLIAFMAHDDLIFPDHLERLARLFEVPHVEFAYTRPLWVTTDGYVVPTAHNLHNPEDRAAFQTRNFAPATCIMHRRSCFATAGYWPQDVHRAGDWHLWRRIARADGSNIAYDPTPTTLHFVAEWKERDRASRMPEISQMLPLIDGADWWPASLKVDVAGAPDEQTAFVRAMAADAGWVDKARTGTILVLDRLARSIQDGSAIIAPRPPLAPEAPPQPGQAPPLPSWARRIWARLFSIRSSPAIMARTDSR